MKLPVEDIDKYDIVWLGENHGIKENYLAYRKIIPLLIERGFTNIAWEMPEDENIVYDDGRFNPEQREFRLWLGEQLKLGEITSISYIDSRSYVESQQDGENKMAKYVVSCATKGKTIVISGSFHSQRRQEIVEKKKVIPAAGLVQRAGYKICTTGLSYAGGLAYNFGVYRLNPSFICFDKGNHHFGTWLNNTNPMVDNDYWFCAGKAHVVIPTQNLNKVIK